MNSAMFLGRVDPGTMDAILKELKFQEGTLLVRYLSVSLSSKMLTVTDCDPLISQILSRIQHWIARHLSYLGRVLLISSISLSIKRFWSQIFPLLFIILHKIQTLCR